MKWSIMFSSVGADLGSYSLCMIKTWLPCLNHTAPLICIFPSWHPYHYGNKLVHIGEYDHYLWLSPVLNLASQLSSVTINNCLPKWSSMFKIQWSIDKAVVYHLCNENMCNRFRLMNIFTGVFLLEDGGEISHCII